ncbi:MAG: BMP family protein [Myxococcota bacterium]
MRAVIRTLSLLGLILAFQGCGPSEREDAGFRVALLTPGSIRDAGWNQSAYEGLLRIQDELGAEVAHQVTRTPQEFEAGFRDFAARGFDLIFGHGFEFQDAAARVAAEQPGTVFVTTSGSTIRPNLAPIVFELEQATYVLGYLGARLSAKGRVAAVGGVKVPSVASTFEAFEAGARRARAEVETSISYLGSWTDVAAAREATLAQIAAGADVLIHNANEAAHGFFEAVRDSPGVLAFGTNRNQNALAPDAVLASATIRIPEALLQVAREVAAGRFEARSIRFGLKSGVIGIEWNESLRSRIPEPLWLEVGWLLESIERGELEVPRGGF